jgi:5,5'-dehydrodivanillate O-demethylase
MGDLLRRYWWPIAGASEFDQPGTKPVRLLGEDLVLYKDRGGRWGLIDRHCRHRRADLSYGYVETRGLRCNYPQAWPRRQRGTSACFGRVEPRRRYVRV